MLGTLYAVLILIHFFTSNILIKDNWIKIIKSLNVTKNNRLLWLKIFQKLTGFLMIIPAILILLSGLDWYKVGTGWIIPFTSHIRFDIYLSLTIIVHASIGLNFALLRRRNKQKKPESVAIFSSSRRDALTVLGSTVLSIVAAIFIDKVPRITKKTDGEVNILPPNQYEVDKLRPLHVGSVPEFDGENWDLEIYGLIQNPVILSLKELKKLPRAESVSDFHCVTGWTKFDNKWEGVRFRNLMKLVQPERNARYVTFQCENNYSTSLPLEELEYDDVILAYLLDNNDLPELYGGPLRLVVPHKYAYKSGKWVRKIKFTENQELGYWEQKGYSNTADPFKNDRYFTTN
jgi:DMSO/TMAO reductase YedYZ molybdopterin-dependent catalytic subunit